MPTYAQLEQEPVWRAQFAPAALTRLAQRLSAASGAPVWIAGDNTHLNGRHRSRDWCLTSKWCTNRGYGTTDGRDKRGDGRWYRALDWAIKGQPLWDACRRLDAAVRAGRLPGVAEWFGTYDGKTVVGWYEGRPSSSDTSHLTHLHVGVWTEVANDDTVMAQIYAVLTGAQESTMEDEMHRVRSGAGDGSIYLAPGHHTPDGKLAIYGLSGPLNEAYKDVPLVQLPAGMKVEQLPWYDVTPTPWPVAEGGGASAKAVADELAQRLKD